MTTTRPQGLLRHLHKSDLRAAAQLATQATLGVTGLVEGVHQSVWSTLGFPSGEEPGRTRGVTGWVYRGIEGTTRFLGQGLEQALAVLEDRFEETEGALSETPRREMFLAALNGVMGDRLVATESPLARSMTLRYRGQPLDGPSSDSPFPSPMPDATGKILLLMHGLCMSDLHWTPEGVRQAPGPWETGPWETLASELGYSSIALRYNSGLHISRNGRELSDQLERLAARWPVPLEEITMVTHSMGGLVARSAAHQGYQQSMGWLRHLKNIVFLGTPHHGALLERVGRWVEVALGSAPYSAPFAKLVNLRSAGITDLRFGNVLDEDWQVVDSCEGGLSENGDRRTVVPLPEGVDHFAVAATMSEEGAVDSSKGAAVSARGDGLVSLDSAQGHHADPRRSLALPETARWIAHGMNHMELLNRPEVIRQVRQWLGAPPDRLSSL